jgi:hypothetical protein
MANKKEPNQGAPLRSIAWLCKELRLGIKKRWVYHSCVMFGGLLEAMTLSGGSPDPSVLAEFEEGLRGLLVQNDKWQSEIAGRARHLVQMMTSGYPLGAEEFVAFCSYLSGWVALEDTFNRLGLDPSLLEPLPSPEAIQTYLSRPDHEREASWIRNCLINRDPSRHWWWRFHENSG